MIDHESTVIIVDNSLDHTGALKAILSTSVTLSDSYEFIFVLPQNTRITQLVRDHEFRVYTLPFVELSKRPRDVFSYLPYLVKNGFALSRLITSHNARIVHVNDYYNLVGIVAKALVPSIALVTHIRKLPNSFPILLSQLWLQLHARFSDKVICVSQTVRRQLRPYYPADLIYDGIRSKEKHPPRRLRNRMRGRIKLLYLGHFIPGKGQDYALEAFRRAYLQCKEIRLRFVGGDMGLEKNRKFRESLEFRAEDWGISDVVKFDGFAYDVEKEIKEADIVLNFSESESFSLACLEALHYGTPLIASDSGGPAELFEHRRSGYLVENRDVNSMIEAILFLARNPEERHRYSSASVDHVKERFSTCNTTQRLKEVYDKLTSTAGARGTVLNTGQLISQ